MTCIKDNQICRRAIFSQSITLVTVDGTDTLVIDIPAGSYADGGRYCLFVTQAIPAANWNVPVAISIGGVTTTVFPLVGCNGAQIIVKQLNTGMRYPVRPSTIGTGSFRVLSGMRCCPTNSPAFLTTPAAATTTTVTASEAARVLNASKKQEG